MGKRKFLTACGAALLFSLGLIGSARSLFYDGGSIGAEGEGGYGIAVDDIEENWQLSDNNQAARYYELYFFVQQKAAEEEGDTLLNYEPEENKDLGYWKYEELAEGVEAQPGYGIYGYRKITVYRSISAEELESVGVGRTDAERTSGGSFRFNFSGWTADKETAAYMIDHEQGEYNYFSSSANLAALDAGSADGSEAGDGKIYLYPIYTLGKDTTIRDGEGGVNARQAVVMLQEEGKSENDPEADDNRFFSQEGTCIDSTYYYYNFTISQEDVDDGQYHLMVSPMVGPSTTQAWTWHGDYVFDDETAGIFPAAGTYDIYVKIHIKSGIWEPDMNWISHDTEYFLNYYNDAAKDEWVDSLDASTVYSVRLEHNGSGLSTAGNAQPMVAFVAVCRVFEPRFLGGEEESFEYNSERPVIYEYEGWFGNSSYSPQTEGDAILRTYAIERVYLNPEDTFFYSHGAGDEYAAGTFRSSVFSVDVSGLDHATNSYWHNNQIEAMSEAELAAISGSSDDWFGSAWHSIGTDSSPLRRAVGRSSEEQGYYDYEIRNQDGGLEEAHRDLLAVDEVGYYDIALAISYYRDITDTGMDVTNPVNSIKEMKIAIRPTTSTYFIKVFANDKFDYKEDSEGRDTFVDWDSDNLPEGNALEYSYEFNSLGRTLGYDEKVFSKEGDDSLYSIGDIAAANGGSIYDHVTGMDLGRSVRQSLTLDRNYILFLSK